MNKENEDSTTRIEINQTFIILFVATLFMFFIVFFHVYARCRSRRRAGNIHPHLHVITSAAIVSSPGLDPSAVNAIPTFVYETKSEGAPLECAVCLSEFEEGETGRVMPDCDHCFHVECIDMWLQCHSDCPLCRTRVKAGDPIENSQDSGVPDPVSAGPGLGWRSGLHIFVLSY